MAKSGTNTEDRRTGKRRRRDRTDIGTESLRGWETLDRHPDFSSWTRRQQYFASSWL